MHIEKMDIRDRIIECLNNVGIVINQNDIDTNLNEYEVDSLTFMTFIVDIEREFNIIIPDGYLYKDILQSLNGFTSLVEKLIEEDENM